MVLTLNNVFSELSKNEEVVDIVWNNFLLLPVLYKRNIFLPSLAFSVEEIGMFVNWRIR